MSRRKRNDLTIVPEAAGPHDTPLAETAETEVWEPDEPFEPAPAPADYPELWLSEAARHGGRWFAAGSAQVARRWRDGLGRSAEAVAQFSRGIPVWHRDTLTRWSSALNRAGNSLTTAIQGTRSRFARPAPEPRRARSRTWSDEPLAAAAARPVEEEPLPVTNLREAALNAWRAAEAEEAAARAKARRQRDAYQASILERLIVERLGMRVRPASGQIEIDGVRLAVRWDETLEDYALVVLSRCPGCGAGLASGNIHDLADLGQVIEDMDAGRELCEECRRLDAALPSTAEQRLVSALRELLADDWRGAGPVGTEERPEPPAALPEGRPSRAGGADSVADRDAPDQTAPSPDAMLGAAAPAEHADVD